MPVYFAHQLERYDLVSELMECELIATAKLAS